MGDSLGGRLWQRLKLRHVVHHTNPFIHIVKSAAILLICYGLDVVTKNPDSITSMFTGLLLVSYSVLLAWYIGTSIMSAAALGTFWGAVMTALFDGFDGIGLFQGETLNRYYAALAIRLALAVVLTIYSLCVLGKNDPGSMPTAYFSAIFVQMVRYEWSYLPSWVNDLNVVSTVIVRGLATALPLVAALLVNGIFSSAFMQRIFHARMAHMEGKIQRNIDKVDKNPFGPHAQGLFSLVYNYIGDLGLAKVELSKRPWDTSLEAAALDVYGSRAKHIAAILCLQVFTALAAAVPVITDEERAELHDVLQGSKKKAAGFESLERIDKALSPRVAFVQRLMLEAMRNLQHQDEHNPIDAVLSRHRAQKERNVEEGQRLIEL